MVLGLFYPRIKVEGSGSSPMPVGIYLRPNETVHKWEFLAVKWAVTEKFHNYLYGNEFFVVTDNNSLTYILIPGTASSGKAGSCLPLVGSSQYRTLMNCMYWFPLPFQLPVVI